MKVLGEKTEQHPKGHINGEHKVQLARRVNNLLSYHLTMDQHTIRDTLEHFEDWQTHQNVEVSNDLEEATRIWDIVQTLLLFVEYQSYDQVAKEELLNFLTKDDTVERIVGGFFENLTLFCFQEGFYDQEAQTLNGLKIPDGWNIEARQHGAKWTGIAVPPGVCYTNVSRPEYGGISKATQTSMQKTLAVEFPDYILVCIHFKEHKKDKENEMKETAWELKNMGVFKSGKPVFFAGDNNFANSEAKSKFERHLSKVVFWPGYRLHCLFGLGNTTSKCRTIVSCQQAKVGIRAEAPKDGVWSCVPFWQLLVSKKTTRLFAAYTKPESGIQSWTGDHDVVQLSFAAPINAVPLYTMLVCCGLMVTTWF